MGQVWKSLTGSRWRTAPLMGSVATRDSRMPPERAPISFSDKDGQLNVVMQEYSAIRGEVLTTLGSQVGTLSFGAATVGLLVAAAATLWKDEGVIAGLVLLFGVPLVCFLTLAIYGGEFVRLTRAGLFLRCLECDLNRAFRLHLSSGGQSFGGVCSSDGNESLPKILLCWEHWSDIRHQERDVDRLNRTAIWLVFFSLAAGFGIVGCVRLITSGLPWQLTLTIALGGVVIASVASWWLFCLRRFALEYRALYAQCS